MNTLRVSYACDDGYIKQTGISMVSLFENNKDFKDIIVYLVSFNISSNNIKILENICKKYTRELKVISFEDIAYDLKISSTGRHIETIYAKLFFGRIEGLNKILYLDSDTIVTESLKNLWTINLDGYCMGMVETYTGKEAKKQLGITKSSYFFNDGVALCNVSYCRQYNLIDKCLNLISKFNGNPPVLSEGVLNKVCENKILALPPKYNMMAGLYQYIELDTQYIASKLHYSIEDLIDSWEHPVVIHYLSGFYNRPWNKSCTHPLKNEFLKYKEMSPWKNVKLNNTKLSKRLLLLGALLKFIGPNNFEKFRNLIKR